MLEYELAGGRLVSILFEVTRRDAGRRGRPTPAPGGRHASISAIAASGRSLSGGHVKAKSITARQAELPPELGKAGARGDGPGPRPTTDRDEDHPTLLLEASKLSRYASALCAVAWGKAEKTL